ncbi:hypothetical protein AR457_11990 [Streptomyces agglomeratus]|uniref:Uncharacterized protein n=1 Tax=Streptomyces agglomeratus TaxID=285458 RepID=A0A1E5P6D1_9ACTN|nr:DUF6304 family protein [Streptomyces agglomeratus]OEJ25075.1 hypothetical protein AS594_11840 [Streptomyces agglomeratus]OEJ40900.1 hypothetical protein BGK70_24660 [Streptomyces agglomeratus]OEJ44722.1 hypothetical protein AR457_11990 [Streptomyces agglomeratus]OEJ53436.1 hypothetical protein BGK72_24260 [Streptomyces agglomeratus]OEJ60776.1 hypothetical protein BGM19_24970 [Streptomyces agglomeratus]
MTGEPWAGWYRDREGSVAVRIAADGQRLRTRIRGVDFEGDSFDALDPAAGPPPEGAGFALSGGSLCDCVLEWDIPMPVYADGRVHRATLSCLLALGRPLPAGGLDREHLALTLHFDGAAYESERAEHDFEHALTVIQRRLPPGAYLRSCISCAFSDYHPAAGGLFGNLACFRGAKEKYRAVAGKDELFELWDERSGFVQETWACADFERRPAGGPGTGYRGAFPYVRADSAAPPVPVVPQTPLAAEATG